MKRCKQSDLPPRQREIVRLVCKGLRTSEIAQKLGLSPFTVSNHLKAVFPKFGVHSRVELVVAVLRGAR
jgi:DNA-binding NarL/FixJ family response regulator